MKTCNKQNLIQPFYYLGLEMCKSERKIVFVKEVHAARLTGFLLEKHVEVVQDGAETLTLHVDLNTMVVNVINQIENAKAFSIIF